MIFSPPDAIYYTATEYKPHTSIDIPLTIMIDIHLKSSAIDIALGEIYTGVFSVHSCSDL